LSRKQRLDNTGIAGIGWTRQGVEKYNDFYDLVKEDRLFRGVTFNNELRKVFLERRRNRNDNPGRLNTRKRKTIPRDDMGAIDTSGETVLNIDGTVQV
jgi:hypothetical protein